MGHEYLSVSLAQPLSVASGPGSRARRNTGTRQGRIHVDEGMCQTTKGRHQPHSCISPKVNAPLAQMYDLVMSTQPGSKYGLSCSPCCSARCRWRRQESSGNEEDLTPDKEGREREKSLIAFLSIINNVPLSSNQRATSCSTIREGPVGVPPSQSQPHHGLFISSKLRVGTSGFRED